MSVRNSSRVSARYARRNNGLMIVRNFLLFTLLLGGCFVLGFKVLAPMLPTGQKNVSANSALPSPTNDDGTASSSPPSRGALVRSTPTRRTPPDDGINAAAPDTTSSRAARKSTNDDGTVLESEDGNASNRVQTPTNADGNQVGADARTSGDPSNPALDAGPGETTDRAGTGDSDATSRTPKKRRRVQVAENPQGDATDATGTATNTNPDLGSTDDVNEERNGAARSESIHDDSDTTAPLRTRNGYYRVQIGVFATREKADAEARRAQEQKLDATVIPVRRHGRILYRVQHAVYQQRDNAIAAEKRLHDKGFDASIN